LRIGRLKSLSSSFVRSAIDKPLLSWPRSLLTAHWSIPRGIISVLPLKFFGNAIARDVYSAGPILRLTSRKAAASPRASIINEMTSVPTVKSINIKSHVKLRQLRRNRGG